MFKVDSPFPEFELESYLPEKRKVEKLSKKNLSGKWFVLFFYPADFTFVCPTELADMQKRYEEFKKLGVEIIGASTDTVFTHKAWLETEELLKDIKYPMTADHNGKFSRELGIYDENIGMAQRAAFIVDPEGILRAADIVADGIGRSAGEILRKAKALKFVRDNPGKVCPASWDEGAATLEPGIEKAGRVYQELQK